MDDYNKVRNRSVMGIQILRTDEIKTLYGATNMINQIYM